MLTRGRWATLVRRDGTTEHCNLGHPHRTYEVVETVEVWLSPADTTRGKTRDGREMLKFTDERGISYWLCVERLDPYRSYAYQTFEEMT